jgi:creatinine amidohydrolase
MRLQLQTWAEVERYLETASTVIMPIGSTEQHGPNGLIGTDAVTSEEIAHAVGARTNTMVAPTIAVGMAQHHMAFTGSMTLRPSTMISVIGDYVNSLAHHGFDRFYFINGHGGNSATIEAAFQEIYTAHTMSGSGAGASTSGGNAPSVRCRLRNWWTGSEMRPLIKQLFGDKDGMHATISEVSVTQYLFPDQIKDVAMGPPEAFTGRWTDSADYRAKFPDGRIASHPELATPEAGKQVFDIAVKQIAEEVTAFRDG